MRLKRIALRYSVFFFTYLVILVSFFLVAPLSSAVEAAAAATAAQAAASTDANKTKAASAFSSYHKTTTQIVVTVTVNTVSKGDFFVELDDEGNLFLKTEDLNSLKLKFTEDRIVLIHDEQFVPASAVLDVKPSFDEKNLTISFIGKTTEAQKTTADVFSLSSKPQNVYYPRETSAFLNYGLTYSYADPLGFQSFSLTNKVGARAGDVFFVSDSLYTKTETNERFVRLQSSATYERRNDLQWYVLGDQFANSGDLGSSINMGGIGFSKVYKLDPYFITQPVFDLKGAVIYPTQAEIYLDGVLVNKQQIAPGTFDLRNIYSYTGSHNVQVVLRDPFGNEQRISNPAYFSTLMLREGLHEYSYNFGFIREQYGLASDDYGKPVFSAFHRYGVTNSLNIGARAEGSDGVYNGGVSTSFLVPRVGAFSLSLAESDANGINGSAGSFQHSYQLGSFSTNVLVRGYSRYYATVSAPTTSTTGQTRYDANFGVGFLLMPLGSFSLNYSETETYGGTNTRVASTNYSRTISKTTSLFAAASETRQATTTFSFFVGLNFNFDNNVHGAIQYNKTGSADTETAQIQKDVPVGEGLGYRAGLSRTDSGAATSNLFNPFVQYNARYGIYSLDSSIQNSAGNTSETYNLSAAGAVVYAGGFYGLSRPVSDSFSIVMLDKVANAKVLNNGQEIGTTGASGKVVVPTLTSYGQNQITVDVKNIPMDYSISGVNKALSPSLWSGSCVAFDALKMQAVTGSLFAKIDGKKIPMEYADISLKVGEKELTFPTGKNGEFYIENTLPKETKEGIDQQSCRAIAERRKTGGKAIKPGVYPASIDYHDLKCAFQISFPETEEVITDLGDIICELPKGMEKPQVTPVSQPEVKPFPKTVVEDDPPHSFLVRLRVDQKGARAIQNDKKALSALARYLMKNPGSLVEIEGHADRHGSDAAATRLGMRMASTIKDYLISSGVAPNRIKKVESLGRSKMLCEEQTSACDAMNRRVVVKIVQAETKMEAARP